MAAEARLGSTCVASTECHGVEMVVVGMERVLGCLFLLETVRNFYFSARERGPRPSCA